MKTRIMSVILAGVVFFFFHTAVNASYTNITQSDPYSSGTGWYGTQENNEVEPGAVTGQEWDLEAFFYDSVANVLGIVGGFNFVDGVSGIQAGDIFLETNDKTGLEDNDFYDYVLDMNFKDKTYTVYDISTQGSTAGTYGGPTTPYNVAGLPWQYTAGGALVSSFGNNGTKDFIQYSHNMTASQIGVDLGGDLSGGHNAAFVDLSFLAPNTNFGSFFTIKCGNDVIQGANSAGVPEPATILLLGFGVAALGARARKKKLDNAKEI